MECKQDDIEYIRNIASMLHEAMGLLMNHGQHEEPDWLAEYELLCTKYTEFYP